MPTLRGALQSLAASGTLVNGVTFRRRGALTILERQPRFPPHTDRRTRAQASLIGCLARKWATLANSERATWTSALPRWGDCPYAAYMRYNARRRGPTDYPSTTFPALTTSVGDLISVAVLVGKVHHVEVRVSNIPPSTRWLILVWLTQTLPFKRSTAQIAGWWLAPPTGMTFNRLFHLTPGTYYYYISTVEKWGRACPPEGIGTVVVLDK